MDAVGVLVVASVQRALCLAEAPSASSLVLGCRGGREAAQRPEAAAGGPRFIKGTHNVCTPLALFSARS